MDAYALTRHDLGMLASAVAGHRRLLISIIFRAIIEQRGLHLGLERAGRDFVLVVIEAAGDAVVGEHRLPIIWAGLDEAVLMNVLRMYVQGLLDGHRRWQCRMVPRLAALGIVRVPSPTSAAND